VGGVAPRTGQSADAFHGGGCHDDTGGWLEGGGRGMCAFRLLFFRREFTAVTSRLPAGNLELAACFEQLMQIKELFFSDFRFYWANRSTRCGGEVGDVCYCSGVHGLTLID
jgi:hypothetical protein